MLSDYIYKEYISNWTRRSVMPRRARLSSPGIPWHIIHHRNHRSAFFYADKDYRRYLDTLKEQAEKYDCLVHTYVLMTTLCLTPDTDSQQ